MEGCSGRTNGHHLLEPCMWSIVDRCGSLCSGKSSTNKPQGEGFDYGWEIPAFPCSPKDLISMGKNTS
jgi:hypothetical protein